jgi:hypothetical protein
MSQEFSGLEPADEDQWCFVIGRDTAGQWLASETHGRAGGFFRTRQAAIHYATEEMGNAPGSVHLIDRPVTLGLSIPIHGARPIAG